MAPEADVILAIRHQLQQNFKEGCFHHVKGHQNDKRRFSELDREAKYNVLCDEYATQETNGSDKTELPYPGSKAMIMINVKWIMINIEQRLKEASTGPEMRKYIIGRFTWSEEDFECVNWKAIEQARKGCTKRENIMIPNLCLTGYTRDIKKRRWPKKKDVRVAGQIRKLLNIYFNVKTNK